MKVTALIPDKLVAEVKALSSGKNITESLIIALNEWASIQRLKQLRKKLKKYPFTFKDGFSAETIRNLNRLQ